MGFLTDWLRGSTLISGPSTVQPHKATVPVVEHKRAFVARQPGADVGVSVHATRDMLTGPAWGATRPDAFISISGVPPLSVVVGQVAAPKSSNMPDGGQC